MAEIDRYFVSLSANTDALKRDLDKATVMVRQSAGAQNAAASAATAGLNQIGIAATVAGQSIDGSMRRSRDSISEGSKAAKLLSSELGLHLPRAVTGVLAKMDMIGPALSAAFNASVVIAIGMALFEAGKGLYAWASGAKEAEAAAKKLKEQQDELNRSFLEYISISEKGRQEVGRIGLTGIPLGEYNKVQAQQHLDLLLNQQKTMQEMEQRLIAKSKETLTTVTVGPGGATTVTRTAAAIKATADLQDLRVELAKLDNPLKAADVELQKVNKQLGLDNAKAGKENLDKLTEAAWKSAEALYKIGLIEAQLISRTTDFTERLIPFGAPPPMAGNEQLDAYAKEMTDRIRAQQDAMMKSGEPSPGAQAVQEYFQTRWDAQQKAITDANKREYESMIDSVRRGAGEVFDAMVARGKGAFQNLKDWIETFFLSRLKMLFQNLMGALFSEDKDAFSFKNIFKNVIPSFGKNLGSGLASVAGGVAGGLGNEGFWSPVSTMPTWSGGQITTGLTSGVKELSKGAQIASAGMVMAGSALLAKGYQEGSKAMGAAGGALAGAGIGTQFMPGLGTAIGAGIGAIAGAITASFNSEAKRIKEEVKETARRLAVQSQNIVQGFNEPLHIGTVLETDIAGGYHEWDSKVGGVTVSIGNISLLDARHVREIGPILANELNRVLHLGGSPLNDTLGYERIS